MKFVYNPAPDLYDPLIQRLGRYPRVRDLTWDALRWCGCALACGLLRLQFPLEIAGEIPDGDRIALIANHQSHLDTIAILAALPQAQRCKLHVLAAEDYFFRRIDRALAASLLCQAVAFDRKQRLSIRDWITRLRSAHPGWLLLYPSGSRKATEIQTGMLKLLLKTGWTVVPVKLEGTGEAWQVGQRFWRPFSPLKVTFLTNHTSHNLSELLEALK